MVSDRIFEFVMNAKQLQKQQNSIQIITIIRMKNIGTHAKRQYDVTNEAFECTK